MNITTTKQLTASGGGKVASFTVPKFGSIQGAINLYGARRVRELIQYAVDKRTSARVAHLLRSGQAENDEQVAALMADFDVYPPTDPPTEAEKRAEVVAALSLPMSLLEGIDQESLNYFVDELKKRRAKKGTK